MPKLMLIFLATLSLTTVNRPSVQANTTQAADDHVLIERRRIVLVRSAELAKQFPHRKTAVVTYPVVSGLHNPAVLRRVRSILDFKNIFDYSLKEYREDTWLTEFSYLVNYNKNFLLDITFSQSGMGAYPDDQSKHFLINLKDGHLIKARDAFADDKLDQMVAMLDRELQRETKRLASENKDPEEKEAVDGAYDDLKFELKDLEEFSAGPKGITFLYDAGFPHVIRALEPEGRYFFTYTALRSFIKRDGPLGQFIN